MIFIIGMLSTKWVVVCGVWCGVCGVGAIYVRTSTSIGKLWGARGKYTFFRRGGGQHILIYDLILLEATQTTRSLVV